MKFSKELYDRISNATSTDYGAKKIDDEYYYFDEYAIESMFEDLFCEIDSLEEKIEDMEDNIRDNYRPISPYEMYGVSERDFH
jgi:septation ring formation regulator EzrA